MKKPVALILVLILVLGAGVSVGAYYLLKSDTSAQPPTGSLQKFRSAAQFLRAFKEGASSGRYEYGDVMTKSAAPTQSMAGDAEAPQHSTTNVQVAGVDEADIVKNDGKFIYAVSGGTVIIAQAYPPESARVVARIDLQRASGIDLFINGDRLAIIGTGYPAETPKTESEGIMPPRGNLTFVRVYDMSDREKPALVRTIEYEGSYSTARMIGDDVHVVLTTHPYYVLYEKKNPGVPDIIPSYSDTGKRGPSSLHAGGGNIQTCETGDPKQFTSFLSILSFSVKGGDESLNKRVIAGLLGQRLRLHREPLRSEQPSTSTTACWWPGHGEQDETTVYKFKLDGPSTVFVGSAEVPGTVLNQFSMDESGGYFRIATTAGARRAARAPSSTNNVYVLDPGPESGGQARGAGAGRDDLLRPASWAIARTW